ncbi:hypothetical protein PR048_016039 [Dryococelus australis]|uniref:Peptidase A2 domain-containing protein n=1 Tax=Dryococelus australis TaxID=614101 RepID=A0ABQ9HIV9_9NEOP|nr:hypothetical protein PR048_016039 [Dryococelus australis]
MFNRILFLCTTVVTMASKVTVEGKELDLQATLNHLASRLEGLERENSDLKRQVARMSVNLKGDKSDFSGTVPMHIRNFTLLPTIPVFSGKPEDNVRVFFIVIEQAANVCNWSEIEQLAFVKLRLAGECLSRGQNFEELKKHLLERFGRKHPTRFYRVQLNCLKILDNESMEEFADRICKINANTYELGSNNEQNEAIKHEADQWALDTFLDGLKGEVGKFTSISRPRTFKESLVSAINVVEADKHSDKEHGTSVKSFSKSVFAVERNGDKCLFYHNYESVKKRVNRARYHMLLLTRMLRDWTSHESQSHVKCIPATVSGDDLNYLTISVTYKGKPLKLLIDTGAQVSLMWQHVVGDLGSQCLQEPKFVVSGLSGHKLKNLGYIVVSMQLGNTAYEMCVQVVQNDCTRYDGIIGLNFLKQYRALVNVAKHSLQLGNKLYSLG